MCERAKDEPLMQYWFRQFKEEPLRVMILATLAGMVYLYQDGQKQQELYREDMKEQYSVLVEHVQKTAEVLSAMETRMGHLEREHEVYRKNGYSYEKSGGE